MDRIDQLGIVHVVDSLEYGGLERVVADLAIMQASRGHRVTVFSICETNGFRSALESAGIPVVVGGKRGGADLRVVRMLRRMLLDRRIHVAHTHNFVPSYYTAAATRWAARAPVLVNTCHNMGSRLTNRRLRWLYRWSLGRSSSVAMVSRGVREHLVAHGVATAEKAVAVLNGIPTRRFEQDADSRLRMRAQLGLAPDAPVIGSVGRLVGLKNQRLLIEALPGLQRDHPGVRLVLVGEGPMEDALRELAARLRVEERVLFTGARTDVPALLGTFDVFALPSRTEGLSIALLEACAAGLPIVATDVGGNGEIVRTGHTGLLIPSDDLPALQDALASLLRDPGQRNRLGQAARDWVVENGSIEAMQKNYDTVYAHALHATPR